MQADFVVRLRGRPAEALDALLKQGYAESKTEAVRNALIQYAMQLGLISKKGLHAEALKSVLASGKKYSKAEIAQQLEAVR